uniref:Uncharacterized protein n=1 Tax=Brassica oleracea var. oleracea TaxID=109376 RepID=A0A0D3C5Y4_BRAOL
MRANLRSLVAKAYRVRQGRTFSSSSSSATNPIDNKGKRSVINTVNNFSNMVACFAAGYVFKFGWEGRTVACVDYPRNDMFVSNTFVVYVAML